ncbi:DUF4105 domain-containing protein [Paracoccus nototheniae]|uniref:DUF4105 domain-containing protein n=1 Tax=Paracoccus nototheniae TaxID=2489002 RepID=A0ABW4E1K0_9RHOB|nr:DUF4105 domain-containing protein [Paracoccus nototheniae]
MSRTALPQAGRSGQARRWLAGAALTACVGFVAGLIALALRFQLDGPARWFWILVVAGVALAVLGLRAKGRRGASRAVAVASMVVALIWWTSIRPSADRDWAPDVAHGVTAWIEGHTAILNHVRNFDWRSTQDFTPRWETRRYDIDALSSVDLATSTWGNPAIAHTLVSFGFSDGAHLTFSAEIRRERDESFSEIGGFFKKFELVMIAADEADILRLRTTIRREDVALYPLDLTPAQRRALFLTYLDKANQLAAEPAFYHTIFANCTTIIFQLARLVEPGIPMDWRILLSGYVPGYLHDHGVTGAGLPLQTVKAQARISRIAQQADGRTDYSVVIRSGAPASP